MEKHSFSSYSAPFVSSATCFINSAVILCVC
ncbi:hypothetical protein EYY54_14495 [Enterococcus faecalis]|nr:hypothetical protein [Enterococcus faecalis]EGO8522875.1 hypothetical protein [Enterococcus faecalis]EGO9006561.1 hypothetical protein [Enterococcus faecalis]MBC2821364.1 hypothetical protein [Enterococcus faecalis]MBC2833813.1 hypothetical protein [Enterococcus faecalis]